MVPERFAIAGPGPDLLATSYAPDRALEEAREDHAERRVEPDHGVGARPHQIAGAATPVVAVDDPRVAKDRARDTLREEIDGYERPVRAPGERVELDMRNAEPTRQLMRESGLAGARRADDGNAFYFVLFVTSCTWYDLPCLFLGFRFLTALMRSSMTS